MHLHGGGGGGGVGGRKVYLHGVQSGRYTYMGCSQEGAPTWGAGRRGAPTWGGVQEGRCTYMEGSQEGSTESSALESCC